MTLAQIMTLALRQLGEDESDIAEYDQDFKIYANLGYDIAMNYYQKPRETVELDAEEGAADITHTGIRRVIAVWDEDGREIPFALAQDGLSIRIAKRHERVHALCEMEHAPLEEITDEPKLPAQAHAALADYICYRHLMNGNMAKQQRAQSYYSMFMQAMAGIRHQGMGSVTQMRNLYSASSIRRR